MQETTAKPEQRDRFGLPFIGVNYESFNIFNIPKSHAIPRLLRVGQPRLWFLQPIGKWSRGTDVDGHVVWRPSLINPRAAGGCGWFHFGAIECPPGLHPSGIVEIPISSPGPILRVTWGCPYLHLLRYGNTRRQTLSYG